MRFNSIALIFLVLSLGFTTMFLGNDVSAMETTDNITMVPIENANMTGTLEDFVQGLISWIPDVMKIFVDIILAPFRAIASIFENWADTIDNSWAGPIIAAFVVIVILIMIRLYTGFDGLLDIGLDWITPGNGGG